MFYDVTTAITFFKKQKSRQGLGFRRLVSTLSMCGSRCCGSYSYTVFYQFATVNETNT